MRADSLFTSLGGARELACTECSSGIEARAAVSVRNSMFEKLITEPGSRYIRAYKGGAVRLENNTYEAATKAFEVQDTGTLSILINDGCGRRLGVFSLCPHARGMLQDMTQP